MLDYKFTVKDKFLKYVCYDTQSSNNSTTFPSTEKQKVLLKELFTELQELGINSEMDEYGYVYAHIRSNVNKHVPAIGFISHVDTSPEVSGADVKPIIHQDYDCKDIVLPKDDQIIRIAENPDLYTMKGSEIITSDGSTLLGGDDKAGVACIMDAANYFSKNPDIRHGDIMIAFTMDEEIGRGLENFDIKKFGAKYAYTIDGDSVGSIEAETFNADKVVLTIHGRSAHTGYAKGKMINASKIAAEFIDSLPKGQRSPETTEGAEGFMHIDSIEGNSDKCKVNILLRDFDEHKLEEYREDIITRIKGIIENYPGAKFEVETIEQYRNMKKIVDECPEVVEYALLAMNRLGIMPQTKPIRGGTDGCKLSYMGIPTPNMFCGEHSFHSRTEWVSVQDMESAVKTLIELCKVWEEKS
ncbi:MAG: peptidase T [Candidatus Woesearchaeota archaeon]